MNSRSLQQGTALIVLAAGFGRRMGQPKLLLTDREGEPLVRRAVTAACASAREFSQTHVATVCNPTYPDVAQACKGLPTAILWNDNATEGMSSSLRIGIAWAVERNCRRAVILLADQPEIQPDVLTSLIRTHLQNVTATVVQACYQGVPGHPILFSSALFPALREVSGDEGGRSVVRAQREHTVYVNIAEDLLLDLDTPGDYTAFLARTPNK